MEIRANLSLEESRAVGNPLSSHHCDEAQRAWGRWVLSFLPGKPPESPAWQSGGSWQAGSGATTAVPRTPQGRAGRAAPLPGPSSSPQWVFLLPKLPIPALERQEGRARTARGGQPCPTWRGPPSRCHPAHRHGNRCSCTSKFPAAQPRVPPAGTCQGPPQPRCRCREWGAGPRIDLPRPRPWVGRSSSWGWLCRQEPLGFLFHPDTRVKDGREVALSWAAANGRLTAANTPLSSPPCWGDRGERMAMRAGRTRGRQVRAQSLSSPLPSLKLRPSQPRTPVWAQGPCPRTRPRGCARRSGTCSPGQVPPPAERGCSFFFGYKGKTRPICPLHPST